MRIEAVTRKNCCEKSCCREMMQENVERKSRCREDLVAAFSVRFIMAQRQREDEMNEESGRGSKEHEREK